MNDLSKETINNWKVYLLLCSDNTYYCGITNRKLEERIAAHSSGKGAKYTRSRTPLTLIAYVGDLSRSEACKLEIKVKTKPKHLKKDFLESYK